MLSLSLQHRNELIVMLVDDELRTCEEASDRRMDEAQVSIILFDTSRYSMTVAYKSQKPLLQRLQALEILGDGNKILSSTISINEVTDCVKS